MRSGVVLLISIAAALTLAGCGTDQPTLKTADSPPATGTAIPTTSAPPSLTPANEAFYGPRQELPGGLLLKRIGKVAESRTQDGSTWMSRLVVRRIDVDPGCDQYKPTPERGHRVVLTVSFETSPAYDSTLGSPPSWYSWSTISPDGISEGQLSSYYGCHDIRDLTLGVPARGEVPG